MHIKILLHQVIHIHIDNSDNCTNDKPKESRNIKGVNDESIIFIVLSIIGIPTDDYSFSYVVS